MPSLSIKARNFPPMDSILLSKIIPNYRLIQKEVR